MSGNAGPGFLTTPGAYQMSSANGSGFVTKLNANASAFLYSSYSRNPHFYIAVDPLGEATIAGTGVGKLNAAGSGVVYSSVLPSATMEALAVDNTGAAYVMGFAPTPSSFPLTSPIQQYSFPNSPGQQIIAKLDTSEPLTGSVSLAVTLQSGALPHLAQLMASYDLRWASLQIPREMSIF